MATDWNKMTINQLKTELTQRGLDNAGKKKADLVNRLEEYEKGALKEEAEMATEGENANEQIEEITKEPEADENGEEKMEEEAEEKTVDVEAEDGNDNDQEEAEKMEEGGEEKEEEVKDDEDKAEGDEDKEEEKKDFYDYTKTASGFVISLDNGNKIVIPSKESLKTDLMSHIQPKTVWVHPIKVEDITSGLFNNFLDLCVHFQIHFHESCNDKEKSENGYIEFIWSSEEQAIEQTELLEQVRENLTVRRLSLKDKRVELLKDLPIEIPNQEQMLKRYLYIGNLPPTATAQALQELFPDANRLAVMSNEEGLPKGYALAEMPTEEAADRATKMYMNVAFEDCNLVILRAWLRIPKGLLEHDNRVELLKTVKRDRLKMRGRNVDMYTRRKLENEMTLAKQRLDRDCKVRVELGLPVPPDIVRREEMLKEQEKKKDGEDRSNEEGDGEKKTPKKFNRNTSAPYRKPVGGRGARRGVPSLLRGGGRYGNQGNYAGRSQAYYNEGGYGNTGGEYNQAVQMLVQVSKMLGTGGGQGSSSYSSGSSYGSDYNSGYSGSYGGSGYSSGYNSYGGTQRKRMAEDDGFGGYNKRGPGARNQRRW